MLGTASHLAVSAVYAESLSFAGASMSVSVDRVRNRVPACCARQRLQARAGGRERVERFCAGLRDTDRGGSPSMSVLDHSLLSERYFFPRPDAPPEPWIVDGLACARHSRRRGVALLHFHGNGEVVADWLGEFASALDAGGVDTYFAEYRGYGGSTGRPSLSALLEDALTVFDAMERAPEEVVVYGRSIGSLAAAHVAAHRPVRALVLESGIADLYERIALRVRPSDLDATEQDMRRAVKASFDQEAKLARSTCPVLLLHTEHDGMVEKHHAERNAAAAGDRAKLIVFPRGDHNTIHAFNGEAIVRMVLSCTVRTSDPG